MVREASKSGADYVKIQAIRSSELVFREKFENNNNNKNTIIRPFKTEFDRLSKIDLTIDDEKDFINECQEVGVKSMITVFTWNGLFESAELGYDAVKIASYDCASFPFIEEIKKRWDKVFISTGATYDHEISKTASLLKGHDYEFLHCVTIYPTPLNQLHLARMNKLKKFTSKVGFSDHTLVERDGLLASKLALSMGASCIERHFTILEPNETKDGPVSITPKKLKELCDFSQIDQKQQEQLIKDEFLDWRTSLGNADRDLTGEELMNREYYRGRFASKYQGKIINNWEDIFELKK